MGLTGHEMPDSDSEAVYEFTQDAQHGDLRDPHSRRRRSLGLDVEPNSVLAFWRLICDTFRKIVDSKYFGRGIMIAILVNTLSMGIEYHEQVGAWARHGSWGWGSSIFLSSHPEFSFLSCAISLHGQEDKRELHRFVGTLWRVKASECHSVLECGGCLGAGSELGVFYQKGSEKRWALKDVNEWRASDVGKTFLEGQVIDRGWVGPSGIHLTQ